MSSGWDELFVMAAGGQSTNNTVTNSAVEEEGANGSNGSGTNQKRSSNSNSNSNVNSTKITEHSKRRKTTQRRAKERKRSWQHNRTLRDAFLESRVTSSSSNTTRSSRSSSSFDTPVSWPRWMTLGPSLLHFMENNNNDDGYKTNGMNQDEDVKLCNGWIEADDGITTTATNHHNERRHCKDCNLSPLHHSISMNALDRNQNDDCSFLELMALVRDVRCCCGCYFSSPSWQQARLFSRAVLERAKMGLDLVQRRIGDGVLLPLDEISVLESKCQALLRSAEAWFRDVTAGEKQDGSGSGDMEIQTYLDQIVAIIVNCDAVYYRLYYLELIELLPPVSLHSFTSRSAKPHHNTFHDSMTTISIEEDRLACIPHPTTYFGTNNLTWDLATGEECLVDFIYHLESNMNSIHTHEAYTDASTSLSATSAAAIDTKQDLSHSHHTDLQSILEAYGISKLEDQEDYANSLLCSHPLLFLRKIRLMETILLFWKSGWVLSDHTRSLTLSSLQAPIGARINPSSNASPNSNNNKNYSNKSNHNNNTYNDDDQIHETPAPKTLSLWRDSCRDLPCSLYAYATLPPKSFHQIQTKLRQCKITRGIIELGAGTGYVARQITERCGIPVRAIDTAPTTASNHGTTTTPTISQMKNALNEYHGFTPGFHPVEKGSTKRLRTLLPNIAEAKETALLLCYPPPDSAMAKNSLFLFLNMGGKCLIHIGEFGGLTGSLDFEQLLLKKMECISRTACVRWGTDAAEVTIWYVKSIARIAGLDTKQAMTTTTKMEARKSSLLLPCCGCQLKESTKRCRLLRSLVYCSKTCFESHRRERNAHLLLNMISVEKGGGGLKQQHDDWTQDCIDWHHPNHFHNL